jgi:hypothetical protein
VEKEEMKNVVLREKERKSSRKEDQLNNEM